MSHSQLNPEEKNGKIPLLTEERLNEILEERFDVEAISQMVEHQEFSRELSAKLTDRFSELKRRSNEKSQTITALQGEVRLLLMDVALLKRAVASLGQVGVMERRKIEKELILELFPPSEPRPGIGVVISSPSSQQPSQEVDCAARMHLCKAACCRIYNVGLTPEEVRKDEHDWDPRTPYALPKNKQGCVHLQSGSCACKVYDNRPKVCQVYSCAQDKRIWQDFEAMVIHPELHQRLASLQVNAQSVSNGANRQTAPGSVFGDENPTTSANAVVAPTPARSMQASDDSTMGGEDQQLPGNPPSQLADSAAPKTASNRPDVSAPDFSELRDMFVAKPKNVFAPPSKD